MAFDALHMEQEEEANVDDLKGSLSELDQERLKVFQTMFNTIGWDYFMRYVASMKLVAINDGSNAKSWEDNRKKSGAREVWEDLENFETSIINEFIMLAVQAEQDALEGEE